MNANKSGAPESAPESILTHKDTHFSENNQIICEKTAKKTLVDLYMVEHYKKYPSIPPQCRVAPKYSDKTANGLTKMVLHWLRLNEHQAERISNTGRLVDRSKVVVNCIGQVRRIGSLQWIKGTGTNGTADISATIAGRSVKIEIKAGRDRQSEAQKEYQRKVESAGGVYLIVRSFDSFLTWYDAFISSIEEVDYV